MLEEPNMRLLRVDPAVRKEQVARLQNLRQRRDNARVNELRQRLEQAAAGKENLMPYIIACVENLVTLGEISDSLRKIFGVYNLNFAPKTLI
jgi:methylmalonyl-CoA mutase N-terminal domain/subunit